MSSPLQAVLTAGLPPAATNTHFFFCKCIQGKRVSLPNPRGRAQHRLRSTVSQPQEGQGAHQGSGGRAVTQHSRCLRSELRAGQTCSMLRAPCSVLCWSSSLHQEQRCEPSRRRGQHPQHPEEEWWCRAQRWLLGFEEVIPKRWAKS